MCFISDWTHSSHHAVAVTLLVAGGQLRLSFFSAYVGFSVMILYVFSDSKVSLSLKSVFV